MSFGKYLKLNLKNKIITSLTCFLLVIFCLLYFIVVPTVLDIKKMNNEIEKQRIDLETKYIKGQSLKKLSENLESIEPKLELLNQIFINKNRELEYITALENRASANGLSQKINLSSPEAAGEQNFQKAGLQLLAAGAFSKQFKYLMDLEALNYYTNIKQLEFSPIKNQGADRVNVFISADTYWK